MIILALLEVTTPASFSWESKCLGVASQKAKVAFVGREGEWYVPSGGALGDIFSLTNNRVQADITSIRYFRGPFESYLKENTIKSKSEISTTKISGFSQRGI